MNNKKLKTLIIVNTTAGNSQAERRWKNFEKDLMHHNITYHAIKTKYPNHATKLAHDAALSGQFRIAVFSGDGTLNEVVQGLFNDDKIISENIRIIFFPAGSSCDFEKKINSNRNWIQRIKSNDYLCIDIFKVECKNVSGEPIRRYIINNSSIGIISQANEKFNSVKGITKQIKKISIDAGAVLCGLQAIAQYKSYSASLTIDNEKIPKKDFSNISIFKTSNFGGDMSYGIDTIQDDGKLSVVWLDKTSKIGLASLMPYLFSGTILKKKQAHYRTCKKLEFKSNNQLIIETDGENIGIPPATYTILPQAIKVII